MTAEGRLAEAIAQYQRMRPATTDQGLEGGQLRLASLGTTTRVVLILDAPDDVAAIAALASNEMELGTDQDVAIRIGDGDVPYDLLIETDVYGPLARTVIGRAVGRVGDGLFDKVRAAALTGEFADELALRRGLPLDSGVDGRSAWKSSEGSLFDEYRLRLQDVRCLLDAAVLAPGADVDPVAAQAAVLGILQGEYEIGDRGILAVLRLARRAGNAAPWLHDLARLLASRAMVTDGTSQRPVRVESYPVRLPSDYPLEDLAADLAAHGPAPVLVTTMSAWRTRVEATVLRLESSFGVVRVPLHECSGVIHG